MGNIAIIPPSAWAEAKREGTVNVVSKRRGGRDCTERPINGADGSKTAEFCSQHAKAALHICNNNR